MNTRQPPFDNPDNLAKALTSGDPLDRSLAAQVAASWTDDERNRLIERLLPDPSGRRWLREHLLGVISYEEMGQLAQRLLDWRDDFNISRRDRTTGAVIRALPFSVLQREAPFVAGTNAASTLWERLSREQPDAIANQAIRVMQVGDQVARETTIHCLLLDPIRPVSMTEEEVSRLLLTALDDPDEEVRGLAADLLADQDSPHLLDQIDRWVRDPGERVRMAVWDTAFAIEFESATARATDLIADDAAPLPARRSALIALGGTLTTAEITPILTTLVAHPQRELAEDAANLLWAYHRTPVIADAASRSPHASVRNIGERLLHPERGSPAAGGSRPGAPEAHRDIYREMIRGLEDRKRPRSTEGGEPDS